MKSKKNIILDAWAMLALIFKEEPAATAVKQIFNQSPAMKSYITISWINIGEVYYLVARKKSLVVADEVISEIKQLPIVLHHPSKADILKAAALKSQHKLSYADAFAVGLAQKVDGIIYTGDPEIVALDGVVNVKRLERK
jgi:predicted nucleic acid-binding protein